MKCFCVFMFFFLYWGSHFPASTYILGFFFHFILDILHKRTVETRVDIICPENHELFSEELMGRRAESIKSIVKLLLGFVAALISSIFPLTLIFLLFIHSKGMRLVLLLLLVWRKWNFVLVL